jgi:uncharacterized protein
MAGKSRRGFASMDPAKQREIASKGGRAAHAKGTAHEWSSEEARQAGRKGGEVVSRDRSHMAAIGREGGEARGRKARARKMSVPSEQVSTERAAASPVAPSSQPSSPYVDREAGISVSREVPGMAAGGSQGTGSGELERTRENARGQSEGVEESDKGSSR